MMVKVLGRLAWTLPVYFSEFQTRRNECVVQWLASYTGSAGLLSVEITSKRNFCDVWRITKLNTNRLASGGGGETLGKQ